MEAAVPAVACTLILASCQLVTDAIEPFGRDGTLFRQVCDTEANLYAGFTVAALTQQLSPEKVSNVSTWHATAVQICLHPPNDRALAFQWVIEATRVIQQATPMR